MKVGIIGAGRWGKNITRTIQELHQESPSLVELCGTATTNEDVRHLIRGSVDAIFIASPPETHVPYAVQALSFGIPVFLEKPVALNLPDTEYLSEFWGSLSHPRPGLFVDYTHLHSDGFKQLRCSLEGRRFHSIYSWGMGIGPFRAYSSLLDYGPHDLSMIFDLSRLKRPHQISCKLIDEIRGPDGLGQLFRIDLQFDRFSSCSWVGNHGDIKRRQLKAYIGRTMSEDYTDDGTQAPPLKAAIRAFLSGTWDTSYHLELTKVIHETLDACGRQIS